MEHILTLTFIMVLAELFEAYIQRAENVIGIVRNLYYFYRQNIFIFFLVQPGFYILLFIVLYTGVLNASMVFLLALKIFDMLYKIELIKQVFIQEKISLETAQLLEMKMPSYFYLLGVFTYPVLLFYALI